MTYRRARGFTLIELLVSLVIIAILAVSGYRALNTVLQTRNQIDADTRKWQNLAFFFSGLEQNVAQAEHRPVRNAAGITEPEWLSPAALAGGNDAELVFTRAGQSDEGDHQRTPQRIGYRLNNNAIEFLRWTAPDQAPSAQPARYTVLDGVREFSLRHLDANGNWQSAWPPSGLPGSLPYALEVSITLASGEKIVRVFALQ